MDAPPVSIDVAALGRQLLGTWADARVAARELSARPEMQRIEGQSYQEHRARVSGQLKLLVENGQVHRAFPMALGGQDDHGGNIAGFEELVTADPSLQIKSGVQWGLFGAAVLHLGTQRHHEKYLPDIMSLATPGAFAMT
ncbi:MAG: acyl-CoA dehydrogenase family protein, partial [Microbacteriaceae bacterium]